MSTVEASGYMIRGISPQFRTIFSDPGGDVWVGIQKVDGVWVWMSNMRPVHTADWTSSDPNGAVTEMCSRMAPDHKYAVGDRDCSETHFVLCQARV